MTTSASIAPGKACGSCAMCCKVYEFADLKKKKGWCENFRLGVGCSIYASRPDPCRAFYCNWMLIEALGPEWKPNICKFVMTYDPSRSILLQVDTSYPVIWRAKPYYDALRDWAIRLQPEKRFIFIFVGKNLTVMTAQGEYDLGFFDSSFELKMKTEMRERVVVEVPYKIKREEMSG